MSPEFSDFYTRNKDAREASLRVEEFLHSCVKVVDIQNVEEVREYQIKDIDLLCTLESGSDKRTIAIEIPHVSFVIFVGRTMLKADMDKIVNLHNIEGFTGDRIPT